MFEKSNNTEIILVEIKRFELLTPCLQGRCSSQLSYTPKSIY